MKKSCMTFFGINLKATSCTGHLFFTALKAGREPKRTNVSLILKDGQHELPHDRLHPRHRTLAHDKHQAAIKVSTMTP